MVVTAHTKLRDQPVNRNIRGTLRVRIISLVWLHAALGMASGEQQHIEMTYDADYCLEDLFTSPNLDSLRAWAHFIHFLSSVLVNSVIQSADVEGTYGIL